MIKIHLIVQVPGVHPYLFQRASITIEENSKTPKLTKLTKSCGDMPIRTDR
jgi:hypothetical protein